MKKTINKYKNGFRSKGLKITRQRKQMLDAILEYQSHFHADELYEKLREQNIYISRATIYRTIQLFCENNIIREAISYNNIRYYECCLKRKSHDHLLCIECGKIIEIKDEKLDKIKKEIYEKYNFTAYNHQVLLNGICENCRRKQNEKETSTIREQ